MIWCLKFPPAAAPFGLILNMNLWLLDSPYVFRLLVHGKLGLTHAFWTWKGSCGACGRIRSDLNGLFCSNFATPRGGWKACESVWCGSCYTKPPNSLFHHAQPSDESGFHWRIDKDCDRHLFARNGDNLITPFQCDLCVFRNLQGCNPTSQDEFLLACIRQVNLDALWGRETATVGSTLWAVKQTIASLNQVRLPPPFPALGPYPVADTFGYSVAIAMIIKSRAAGRYADYQQYESIRKLRAGFSNVFMASVLGNDSLRTMGGTRRASNFSTLAPPTLPGLRDLPGDA